MLLFRKKTILWTICTAFSAFSLGQSAGKVLDQKVVKSTILGRNVFYTVYLPSDYDNSQRSYPVVYLLHGYGDDNTGWLQFGEVNRYADKAIAEGTIPPMIIIMPNGDSSWFMNSFDGKEKYEDFFVDEFIPTIEKTYRVKAEKRYRAIAGLSMGGFASFLLALKHPDLFAAAAPLSAAIYDNESIAVMEDKAYEVEFAPMYGHGLKGKERLTPHWYNNSILNLVENKTVSEISKVRYWVDCGDKDELSVDNCQLHIAFMRKGVPHEFRIRDGVHSWTYWRSGITDALHFIGQSFHQR